MSDRNGWKTFLRSVTRLLGDDSHLPLGTRGERAARRWLRRQGMKIVGVNERIEGGEIDLIAVDRDTVVFVEVKTRKDGLAGQPEDAVDVRKQRKLTQLALRFMRQHGLLESPSRFDVVSVTWGKDARRPKLKHFVNAFEPIGDWQLHS